jgi:hypothetical protein
MSDFKAKNFDTLEEGYNHLAAENERLRVLLAEARAVLTPFAAIKTYPDDADANLIFLSSPTRDFPENIWFSDLAAARKFMEDTKDV